MSAPDRMAAGDEAAFAAMREVAAGEDFRALEARLALAGSMPLQVAINAETQRYAVSGTFTANDIMEAACAVAGNIVANLVFRAIASGCPAAVARTEIGGLISVVASRIIDRMADGSVETPEIVSLDGEGKEVPFDFRTMMKGGEGGWAT